MLRACVPLSVHSVERATSPPHQWQQGIVGEKQAGAAIAWGRKIIEFLINQNGGKETSLRVARLSCKHGTKGFRQSWQLLCQFEPTHFKFRARHKGSWVCSGRRRHFDALGGNRWKFSQVCIKFISVCCYRLIGFRMPQTVEQFLSSKWKKSFWEVSHRLLSKDRILHV